jgi:hypothetical protein
MGEHQQPGDRCRFALEDLAALLVQGLAAGQIAAELEGALAAKLKALVDELKALLGRMAAALNRSLDRVEAQAVALDFAAELLDPRPH